MVGCGKRFASALVAGLDVQSQCLNDLPGGEHQHLRMIVLLDSARADAADSQYRPAC